jgi:hypothetical protein
VSQTAAQRAAYLRDLLGEQATWVEPAADGSDALREAIQAEPRTLESQPTATARRPGRLMWLSVAASLVLLAAIVGVVVFTRGEDESPARQFALSGTELAPDAAAVATVTELQSGIAIVLEISGLPPSAPGTYYQGWVRDTEDAVAVGTFHMRGGDGAVELWSGVDLDRYPTVTVTLQEEGAGPESSGQVVLTGEVGAGD